jgi:hypothetical protein
VESGSTCRSERSNLFSVLYGPRVKTLRLYQAPAFADTAVCFLPSERRSRLRRREAAIPGSPQHNPFAQLIARNPSDPQPILRLN